MHNWSGLGVEPIQDGLHSTLANTKMYDSVNVEDIDPKLVVVKS